MVAEENFVNCYNFSPLLKSKDVGTLIFQGIF
jgi:hypothetical protein